MLKFGADSLLNSSYFEWCTGLKTTPIGLKFGGQIEEIETNNFYEENFFIRDPELDVSGNARRLICTGTRGKVRGRAVSKVFEALCKIKK